MWVKMSELLPHRYQIKSCKKHSVGSRVGQCSTLQRSALSTYERELFSTRQVSTTEIISAAPPRRPPCPRRRASGRPVRRVARSPSPPEWPRRAPPPPRRQQRRASRRRALYCTAGARPRLEAPHARAHNAAPHMSATAATAAACCRRLRRPEVVLVTPAKGNEYRMQETCRVEGFGSVLFARLLRGVAHPPLELGPQG